MKAKTIVPLVIGLVVGFFAIKMGVDMVKKAKGAQAERRSVFVSAKSIEVAAKITESMLTAKEVPAALVPDDAFTDAKALLGRVTSMPIAAGVPITRSMLAPVGAQPGLGAKIPPGHRAVSVSVNEQSAVAGFITPGSRVDVSAVYGHAETESRLILSNIEVGAVGQSLSRTGPDGKAVHVAKSVTLFLTPAQVQVLNAAMGTGKGRIRLALRGYGDEPSESFLARFFKKAMQPRKAHTPAARPSPKPKPRPQFHVVEVRRGELAERLIFDQHGGVRRVSMEATVSQDDVLDGPPVDGRDDGQNSIDMEADE